jgi:hypothetical protein
MVMAAALLTVLTALIAAYAGSLGLYLCTLGSGFCWGLIFSRFMARRRLQDLASKAGGERP